MPFAWIAILLVLALLPVGAKADDAELPLCETSTGEPGRLFVGILGTVQGPPGTRYAHDRDGTLADENLRIWGTSIPLGIGVAVLPLKPGPVVINVSDASSPPGVDANIIHVCRVDVVDFDMDKHGVDAVRSGRCDLEGDLETPMRVGETRLLVRATPNGGVGLWSSDIADISLNDGNVLVRGLAPGVTNFYSSRRIEGEATQYALCTVLVVPDEEGAFVT